MLEWSFRVSKELFKQERYESQRTAVITGQITKNNIQNPETIRPILERLSDAYLGMFQDENYPLSANEALANKVTEVRKELHTALKQSCDPPNAREQAIVNLEEKISSILSAMVHNVLSSQHDRSFP